LQRALAETLDVQKPPQQINDSDGRMVRLSFGHRYSRKCAQEISV
jgi:hypothetical protein